MAINMTKGQRVSLEKPGGGQLTRIRMGLGLGSDKHEGHVRTCESQGG